jgi:RNA 3'-terminal phosphate cyclase (ATP)
MIQIDGSYGEGGGQVIRTSLALAVLSGQPLQLVRIRAGRRTPGLGAQHFTAVRAAASICDAVVQGDQLGSQELHFSPGGPAEPGSYTWDVAEMRKGGSAGATSLVLQTILLPLALAPGRSKLVIRGGTHVPWSPPFLYLDQVYLAILARCGISASVALETWGFYPAGGGELVAEICGSHAPLQPLTLTERAPLQKVWGTAVVSNLPSHIPQRMANRAMNILAEAGLQANVQASHVRARGPGAGIFLLTEDQNGVRAGFSSYGRKGLPAEEVAADACQQLLDYYLSEAPVDAHLADQLILPLALADGTSRFTVSRLSEHLCTNMWVVEQFAQAHIEIVENTVTVKPRQSQRDAANQPLRKE